MTFKVWSKGTLIEMFSFRQRGLYQLSLGCIYTKVNTCTYKHDITIYKLSLGTDVKGILLSVGTYIHTYIHRGNHNMFHSS